AHHALRRRMARPATGARHASGFGLCAVGVGGIHRARGRKWGTMIVVVGLSHHTAPIEVRERAALATEAVAEILEHLRSQEEIGEVFIVSTCNRVEIIAAPREQSELDERLQQAVRTVEAALLSRAPGLRNYLYRLTGIEAV